MFYSGVNRAFNLLLDYFSAVSLQPPSLEGSGGRYTGDKIKCNTVFKDSSSPGPSGEPDIMC